MKDQHSDILTHTASERFGIDYLFPYQRLVITNILRRAGYFGEEEQEEAPHHQVVLLPTGAGKSLCFMLPACLLEGLTIVAFPLLGLMADQLRRVEEAGMTGILLKGGMTPREKEEAWRKIENGKVQMLLTNPEMLILPEVRRRLAKIRIAHLVLDEAHTIPEWGESFRPACLELGKILSDRAVKQREGLLLFILFPPSPRSGLGGEEVVSQKLRGFADAADQHLGDADGPAGKADILLTENIRCNQTDQQRGRGDYGGRTGCTGQKRHLPYIVPLAQLCYRKLLSVFVDHNLHGSRTDDVHLPGVLAFLEEDVPFFESF